MSIKNVNLPAEDAVVERDEAPMPETAVSEPEQDKTEYIEFVGEPPYGTEFSAGHSVSRKHFKEYHDITTTKDLEWTKGKNGRFLVPVADMSPEAAEHLVDQTMFRKVTL
jgi:hypothetical protein